MKNPDKAALGFTPYAASVFAGNAPDTGNRFADRMGEMIPEIKPGDYRDWKKMEAWEEDTVAK
ncbi:MAG: hypothetical protein LLG37_03965 [Spirochaetia bacterium]|nr:hypothetical protein [Spirochaetia bacterium]